MPSTESEVIERAIKGDRVAFREIVEQYQRFSQSLSYRMVGSTSDAEDITQEAFIRLWKNLHKYRFEIKLSTWLYTIVTNLCLDYLRSKRYKKQRLDERIDTHHNLRDKTSSDDALISEELRTAVVSLAEGLTPMQKAVFVLRDLEDLPMEEIAKIMSMRSGSVKSNLYYARRKMGTMIEKYYAIHNPETK